MELTRTFRIGIMALAMLAPSTLHAAHPDFDEGEFDWLRTQLERDGIQDVHAVLVDYKGERVFEEYYEAPDADWGTSLGTVMQTPDRRHDLRSVSKSVAAIALGIALGDDWRTDLERPLISFFPDHADRAGDGIEAVTLADALTMRAGLQWNEMTEPYRFPDGTLNENNDEIRLYGTGDPLGLVLARPVVSPPGGQWYYNGGLTQAIGYLVEVQSGQSFLSLVEERLFDPMGIEGYDWRTDEDWADGSPPAIASGLRLTPDDLAKFGKLILQRGTWEGEQLVDPEWIDEMIAAQAPSIPWFNFGEMTSGYGFQWYRGRLRGQDVAFGVGNGDQRLMVFPALDMVITIMAGRYNNFTQATGQLVGLAVLDALDDKVEAAALEPEIWAQVEKRNATWVSMDFEEHMSVYHPDFQRWALNSPRILDRETFAGLWDAIKADEEALTLEVLPERLQWLVPGQAAVAHYTIDETWLEDGKTKRGNLRFSDIFVLHEGQWLYMGGHRDGMALPRPPQN
ncbi:serine hydrolase [Sphingomicrobium sediminis]|uniref:Serine hydrolase n=1 Tax=Sphingomicrobium sediminis TaxID=2950949 RepID=A0A9X2EGV0_9SPHN|nr:serine hydrolase [Sphingomicrobium sediminis]MCM8557227.1 serine hydrolase [Sphingomicrobium sediminis]